MKKLIYIFIPILAILLMSHNTYATSYGASGVYGWNATNSLIYESWSVTNLSSNTLYSYNTGNGRVNGMSLRANSTIPASSLISMTIRFCGATYNGWSGSANQPVVEENVEARAWGGGWCYISNVFIYNRYATNTVATVYPYFMGDNTSSTPLEITISPMTYVVLTSESSDAALSDISAILSDMRTQNNDIWNMLNSINNNISNLSSDIPSAQDIADAVNAPEEEAAEDISNQSTDDIETGDDSSATNLIGNINTIFSQIGAIEASDTCSVPADFGHLDLGNLNLCTGKDKLPFVVTFGAYAFELIFVIGTAIILIKQVLGLFDWARS